MKKIIYGLFLSLFIFSCSDDNSLILDDVNKDNTEIVNKNSRLSFNSEEDLSEFIENIKIYGRSTIKSRSTANFTSLYDKQEAEFFSRLTPEELTDFKNDPDEPEFYFNDSIIFDDAFASVINENREVELSSKVYKYVDGGIYVVDKANDFLLDDVSVVNTKNRSNDFRIKFYPTSYVTTYEFDSDSEIMTRANETLSAPLYLKDGTTIPANRVRDLNFKDRGDAGWLSNLWSSIWGKKVVAENKFSSNRKMIVTFYSQDYIIYKAIGTSVKMQKKKWWWWTNIKADQIHIGWDAIEIEQKTSSPSLEVTKSNIFNTFTQKWEIKETVNTPAFLKKNFSFSNNYVLFTVPYVNYDLTSKNINSVYSSLVKKVPGQLKSLFPNETKNGIGVVSFPNAYTTRFIIDKKEEYSKNAKTKDYKFHSNWFGGTYLVGFSYNNNNNSFNYKNISFKTSNTNLKRGSVYGAVKYNGSWLAGRILKDE